MHPDLMRLVDRWLGIPCCFLTSLWLRISDIWRSRRSEDPPQRILFIGLAEIGALVIAHSAIQRARTLYPQAELYFLTFETGRDVLAMLGFDEAHCLILRPTSPIRLLRDTASLLLRFRRLGIDATVNFEVYVRFSTLLAALSGAGRRAGFYRFNEEGHYLGNLITHRAIYSPQHHAATSYQLLVEALSEAADREPRAKIPTDQLKRERLRLDTSAAARETVRDKLEIELDSPLPTDAKLVILNANASDLVALRRWPLESYVELARRLLENPTITVILTGSPSERQSAARLKAAIGTPRVANMAGRTTLRELLDLFNTADLMVTNDSGPAHLASATDLPTLVLFGPESPRIFGPLGPRQRAIYLALGCSPCVSVYNQKRSPCRDNRCMTGIMVERVYEESLRLLTEGPADSPPN